MEPPEDNELVERSKKGDRSAYDALVRRHQDRVFNLIYRCVGDHEDANDIAQEVFIRAYRAIVGFHGRSAFYTWLHRIAINEIISHRRRAGSRRRIQTVSISQGDGETDKSNDPPDSSLEPSKVMDKKEREAAIQEAITSLDEEHRTIVVLKDVEGYGYGEIAELIGCPKGTVKSRLHRARLELRERLRSLVGVAEEEKGEGGDSS